MIEILSLGALSIFKIDENNFWIAASSSSLVKMDLNELSFDQWKDNFICNNEIDSAKDSKLKLSQYLDHFSVFLTADTSNNDLTTVLAQLDAIWDFIMDTFKGQKDCHLLSVNVMKKYSLLYTNVLNFMLQKGHQSFNLHLVDISNKLNALLLANLKKLSMKSNWYSSMKHLVVIMFQSILDRFDGFLNNYKGQVLTSVYKHLSKLNDNLNSSLESGLFKANYFNDMVILVSIIISHDTKPLTDEKLFIRMIKMVKFVTAKNSNQKFLYPLVAVTNAFSILTNLLKSDKFISPLVGKNPKFSTTHYISSVSSHLNSMVLAMDTDDKHLRFSVSKNLSDLLVFTYLSFPEEDKLEICLNFILFEYRKENQTSFIKIGMIESLIQFLSTLNLYYKACSESNFITLNFFKILNTLLFHFFDFGEINLKLIKSKLKEHKFVSYGNPSIPNDSLKALNHLKIIFKFIIKEIDNDLNKFIILSKLMFFETSNVSNGVTILPLDKMIQTPTSEIENIWYTVALIQLTEIIIDDLGEYILTNTQDEQDSDFATKLLNQLLEFCSNKNFKIRILTVELLVKILKIKPELILNVSSAKLNTLIESFNSLNEESKSGNFNENHGTSLLISSILSFSPNDYITNDFILNTFSLSLNFLKKFNSNLISNNLFSNDSGLISNADYEKQLISWILLMGVFNFNKFNTESILLQDTTQFLNIWKNLLNLNFVDLNGVLSSVPEIMKLLEVKNYSLVCLSTFISYLISSSKMSIDLTKSLNQILSLSFTAITTLENLLLAKHVESSKTVGLAISINKLRIYQNYMKLLPYLNVKNEISSNMLIEIVKNFSDISKFQPSSVKNFKKKDQTNDIYRFDDQFGMTSKLNGFQIEELMFKLRSNQHGEPSKPILESKENENVSLNVYWFDIQLENRNSNYFTYSSMNDPLMRLLNGNETLGYTGSQDDSPDYHTMIVDISIEIFALTFPYLSAKIQQSIIENMRSNVFFKVKESASPSNDEEIELKKSIDLRRKSIGVNCSVALYSLLSFMMSSNLKLRFEILDLILETVKNVDLNDDHLRFLNSQSFGMCNSLFDEEQDGKLISEHLNNQISVLYNSIIENSNPNSRSFDILSLGFLTKYTNIGNLKLIEDAIFTLLFDPHPVVHSSSMLSLDKFMLNNLSLNIIMKTINSLEMIMIDDTFGLDNPIIISNDLNFKGYLNSNLTLSKLVENLISLSGPMASQWDLAFKTRIMNIMSNNLKLSAYQHFEINLMENMKFYGAVSMFDKSSLPVACYIKLLENVIKDNLFIGLNTNQKFNTIDYLDDNLTLFPMSTSTKNLELALDSLYQLVKMTTKGNINITQSFKDLIWIAYEMYPLNISSMEVLKIFTMDEITNGPKAKISILEKLIQYFFISKNQLDKPLYDQFKLRADGTGLTKVRVIVAPTSKSSKNRSESKNDEDDDDEPQESQQEQQQEAIEIQDSFNKVLNLNEEQPNWRFKTYVIKLVNMTLDECFNDRELKMAALKRLDDIIKISFISSTNNLNELRIESLKLLNKVIDLFSNVMDPLYANKSILDQQNAQIISTVIPTFNKNSSLKIASEGLLISSKLITKDGNFDHMKRLVKVLTTTLENLAILNKLGEVELNEASVNDIEMIKIGELEILSNKAIDKVKVRILQAWANVVILTSHRLDHKEDLTELILNYSDILIPLLIHTIREFIIIKYSPAEDGSNTEGLELYDECKVDLIEAISILIEDYTGKFENLLGDDVGKIFIILFSEMFEYFIKMLGREGTSDDLRMLKSFRRILAIDFAVDILFNDSIYLELVDLVNKLILINDGDCLVEINAILRDIFVLFFDKKGGLDNENVDKLFELIRLQLKIIIKKLPFIRAREVLASDKKLELTGKDLIILRRTFMSIVEMNDRFPIDIRKDILINLTFMLVLIHECENGELVSMLLPVYQTVFSKFSEVDPDEENLVNLLGIFNLKEDVVDDQLVCFIMLRAIPNLKLTEKTLAMVQKMIMNGLQSKDEKVFSITVKTLKALIQDQSMVSQAILVGVLPEFVSVADELQEPRLVVELTLGLIKREGVCVVTVYQLAIKLLLEFGASHQQFAAYVQEKMLELVGFNMEAFKGALEELDEKEKIQVENVLKGAPAKEEGHTGHIELKAFV